MATHAIDVVRSTGCILSCHSRVRWVQQLRGLSPQREVAPFYARGITRASGCQLTAASMCGDTPDRLAAPAYDTSQTARCTDSSSAEQGNRGLQDHFLPPGGYADLHTHPFVCHSIVFADLDASRSKSPGCVEKQAPSSCRLQRNSHADRAIRRRISRVVTTAVPHVVLLRRDTMHRAQRLPVHLDHEHVKAPPPEADASTRHQQRQRTSPDRAAIMPGGATAGVIRRGVHGQFSSRL